MTKSKEIKKIGWNPMIIEDQAASASMARPLSDSLQIYSLSADKGGYLHSLEHYERE
jgi:hypothetical protein